MEKFRPDYAALGEWNRDASVRFLELAIKTILTLNGGGAIALLTFIGHSADRFVSSSWALPIFGVGAACSGIAAVFQHKRAIGMAIVLHRWARSASEGESKFGIDRQIGRHAMLSEAFVVAGLACFLLGLLVATKALLAG